LGHTRRYRYTTFSQYGFYWDYQQRTRSFYVGKQLPAGVKLIVEQGPVDPIGDPKLSHQP